MQSHRAKRFVGGAAEHAQRRTIHAPPEAEYLALEAASEEKHEFVDGSIVAMAGAGPAHNALAVNIAAALLTLARGRGVVSKPMSSYPCWAAVSA